MEVLSEYCLENRRYCWSIQGERVYCKIETWVKGKGFVAIWDAVYSNYYPITRN